MSYSDMVMDELRIPQEALGVRRMMEFLVKTEDDYRELNAGIIEQGSIAFALSNMRKLRLGKLTLEQFTTMYNDNKKNALEQLFQEQIKNRDITLIDKKSVTPTEIFNKHKEIPTVSFIQVIYKEL